MPFCPVTLLTAVHYKNILNKYRNTKFSPRLVLMKTVSESITSLMCDVCWSVVCCVILARPGQPTTEEAALPCLALPCLVTILLCQLQLPANHTNQLGCRLTITTHRGVLQTPTIIIIHHFFYSLSSYSEAYLACTQFQAFFKKVQD